MNDDDDNDDDDGDIKVFNGTSTPTGSYSAKAGVNCRMGLNRVH